MIQCIAERKFLACLERRLSRSVHGASSSNRSAITVDHRRADFTAQRCTTTIETRLYWYYFYPTLYVLSKTLGPVSLYRAIGIQTALEKSSHNREPWLYVLYLLINFDEFHSKNWYSGRSSDTRTACAVSPIHTLYLGLLINPELVANCRVAVQTRAAYRIGSRWYKQAALLFITADR